MVWGVCALRGVGQVFTHVGMKAHVAHACRRNLCVSLSLNLTISYLVLRVLVRACRQEELHGGGVTVGRGLHESRGAILCMRGKG